MMLDAVRLIVIISLSFHFLILSTLAEFPDLARDTSLFVRQDYYSSAAAHSAHIPTQGLSLEGHWTLTSLISLLDDAYHRLLIL
jgi:hypothetical protein